MLSTWGALSSSQEDTKLLPELLSTTRLDGWRICLLYSRKEIALAAPSTTTNTEPRYVDIDVYHCPIIIFQTMLVTGGHTGGGHLSSTELLVEATSAWVFTGELPSARGGLRGANIDNKIIMTGIIMQRESYEICINWSWLVWPKKISDKFLGGYDGSWRDEILEFDPLTGQWKEVNRMTKGRSHHAVSVMKYSEAAQFCNWGVNRYSRVIKIILKGKIV